MMKRRFYTVLRFVIPYKNVVVTPWNFNHAIPENPANILLDVGIHEIFMEKKYDEYPSFVLDKYLFLAGELSKRYGERFLAFMPDYPPFWGRRIGSNVVKKTFEMAEYVADFKGVNWLPIVQWEWGDLRSFSHSLELMHPIIKKFGRLAVAGGVGKECKQAFGMALRIARRRYPTLWIHALGLKLSHKNYVEPSSFDSFDTSLSPGSFYYRKSFGNRENFNRFLVMNLIAKIDEAYGPLE
jgi:hypothetical protein